jgi:hypothetical protein
MWCDLIGDNHMGLNWQRVGIWRLSLEQIEATVADGRGRVPGNPPGPCFSRQVVMYLAKNVVGWSAMLVAAGGGAILAEWSGPDRH